MEATSVDWNHETNTIVSGSIDRSVFVWKFNESVKRFEAEFVNMDEKLSIIDINWSKNGEKFVVGTSSKLLYMVHKYTESDVKGVNWNSKQIKAKFNSSIVSCCFEPSGRVIAAASFDGSCKVISCVIPSIDANATGVFKNINDFGTPILEF